MATGGEHISKLPYISIPDTRTGASQPAGGESLRWSINKDVRNVISEESADNLVTSLLYDLICGTISATLVADEIVSSAARDQDADAYLSSLSRQILFLVSEYLFLQFELVGLEKDDLELPTLRTELMAEFALELATRRSRTMGTCPKQGGGLRNSSTIISILIVLSHEERVEESGITGLDDALFILITALEDHPEFHRSPTFDIPAAAQYVICSLRLA